MNGKLILYVAAGVALGAAVSRLVMHRPFILEVSIIAAVAIGGGLLLSLPLPGRRRL